jgi:hypothetical protein
MRRLVGLGFQVAGEGVLTEHGPRAHERLHPLVVPVFAGREQRVLGQPVHELLTRVEPEVDELVGGQRVERDDGPDERVARTQCAAEALLPGVVAEVPNSVYQPPRTSVAQPLLAECSAAVSPPIPPTATMTS